MALFAQCKISQSWLKIEIINGTLDYVLWPHKRSVRSLGVSKNRILVWCPIEKFLGFSQKQSFQQHPLFNFLFIAKWVRESYKTYQSIG